MRTGMKKPLAQCSCEESSPEIVKQGKGYKVICHGCGKSTGAYFRLYDTRKAWAEMAKDDENT